MKLPDSKDPTTQHDEQALVQLFAYSRVYSYLEFKRNADIVRTLKKLNFIQKPKTKLEIKAR